jgi:hypothetical protein
MSRLQLQPRSQQLKLIKIISQCRAAPSLLRIACPCYQSNIAQSLYFSMKCTLNYFEIWRTWERLYKYRARINYRRISLRHNLSRKYRKIVKFVSITHSERNILNGPIVATAISQEKRKPVLEGNGFAKHSDNLYAPRILLSCASPLLQICQQEAMSESFNCCNRSRNTVHLSRGC